jgi:aarF domain-containing kinase
MKAVASAVTWILPSLKWLSLEDCVEDFGQLMKAQVNLCVEARNLEKFAVNFVRVDSVRFPKPLWHLVRPYVLVETYEEGVPVQHYVTDRSSGQFNAKLAELGIDTILKMVFEDNFAHGDLHPGNILVRETEVNDKRYKKLWYTLPLLIFKSRPCPISIVILDCGIIASLDDRGKRCLKGVFKAVACGDGEKVGELFLNHSVHQCTNPESFKHRMSEIVSAALNRSFTLEQIDVSTLMTSLFSALIEHKVKLDGSFSSIILAIMVVEGLGRSLDPTLDIIQKAKPFLLTPL